MWVIRFYILIGSIYETSSDHFQEQKMQNFCKHLKYYYDPVGQGMVSLDKNLEEKKIDWERC